MSHRHLYCDIEHPERQPNIPELLQVPSDPTSVQLLLQVINAGSLLLQCHCDSITFHMTEFKHRRTKLENRPRPLQIELVIPENLGPQGTQEGMKHR